MSTAFTLKFKNFSTSFDMKYFFLGNSIYSQLYAVQTSIYFPPQQNCVHIPEWNQRKVFDFDPPFLYEIEGEHWVKWTSI